MLRPDDDEQLLENVMSKLGSTDEPPKRLNPERKTKPWCLPGFSGNARVTTSFGDLPIEALRLRDPVKTRSGRFLKVQWIDKVQLDEQFLSLHPEANPILIPDSSLGSMTPCNDVLVSPGQVLRMPRQTSDMKAMPAQSLVWRRNVERKPQRGFTYYLFHCGEPASISVEGLWFEVVPG
ncbi:MAG: Hint domain-containing protein [Roseobacter sp.]